MKYIAINNCVLLVSFICHCASAEQCKSYPLVGVSTGKSTTCEGNQQKHWYPLDLALCHGWAASDDSHLNSASNMQCVDENTFSFVQFAGNTDCNGVGVPKTVKLNECEQDFPPTLYSIGVDLSCCKDPNSTDCKRGSGSTDVSGSRILNNGVQCDAQTDEDPESSSDEDPESSSDFQSLIAVSLVVTATIALLIFDAFWSYCLLVFRHSTWRKRLVVILLLRHWLL